MMTRRHSQRKCRVALIAIAARYLNKSAKKMAPSRTRRSRIRIREGAGAQAFTLDVIDAITIDAILN